ncbi:DNA-directed RNA polymerase V subunit 7 [Camellia lanceoleosa]|nr:DNA-directed RNA polymerase V subunit 7 [Camellia lanceoleosa]
MFLKVQLPWNVVIPAESLDSKGLVLQKCITFKLHRGKILEGVVHKILKHGVFLRCGPVENIYLSNQKMRDYRYVPGENPIFMNDKMSIIEKEVAVRFIVIGTKYIEAEKDFQAVVSLEGDFLGPVGPVS